MWMNSFRCEWMHSSYKMNLFPFIALNVFIQMGLKCYKMTHNSSDWTLQSSQAFRQKMIVSTRQKLNSDFSSPFESGRVQSGYNMDLLTNILHTFLIINRDLLCKGIDVTIVTSVHLVYFYVNSKLINTIYIYLICTLLSVKTKSV